MQNLVAIWPQDILRLVLITNTYIFAIRRKYIACYRREGNKRISAITTLLLYFLETKRKEHAMKENAFQASLIKEIKERFPGCIVMKNDPTYIQGIPDLTILWNDKWAVLECKKSKTAKHRPNQNYWVKRMNVMSFASFIFPENKESVLNELERSFKFSREACVPKRKQVPLAKLRRRETSSNILKPPSCTKRNRAS